MNIEIKPDFINFSPPNYEAFIQLKNKTQSGAAYVIKSTSSSNYVVKPAIGVIIPLHDTLINIKALNIENDRLIVEIYEFDWRSDMKIFLKSLNDGSAKILMKKKIKINKPNDEYLKENIDIRDILMYFFVFLGFIKIIRSMLN